MAIVWIFGFVLVVSLAVYVVAWFNPGTDIDKDSWWGRK